MLDFRSCDIFEYLGESGGGWEKGGFRGSLKSLGSFIQWSKFYSLSAVKILGRTRRLRSASCRSEEGHADVEQMIQRNGRAGVDSRVARKGSGGRTFCTLKGWSCVGRLGRRRGLLYFGAKYGGLEWGDRQ